MFQKKKLFSFLFFFSSLETLAQFFFVVQIQRKLKRKRKQKRKRGSLREGREAPPRRCPPPLRFCFHFRFNLRWILTTKKKDADVSRLEKKTEKNDFFLEKAFLKKHFLNLVILVLEIESKTILEALNNMCTFFWQGFWGLRLEK